MSTVKISELPVLSSADAADEFVVVDDSAGVTKKITQAGLANFGSNTLTAGGITFGADTLDDYEEGTFIPAYVSRTATDPVVSYNYRKGAYVKIGDIVFVEILIRLLSVTSTGTGFLGINLPFTTADDSAIGTSTLNIGLTFDWPGEVPSSAFINNNVDIATLTKYDTTSAVTRLVDVPTSDLATGGGARAMIISGFFRTTA